MTYFIKSLKWYSCWLFIVLKGTKWQEYFIEMDYKKTKKRFFYLNIGRKLLLGYLTLILFTILNAFFALHYLEKLNTINESISETNIPLSSITEKMIESIYSQELYGHRYTILKSKKMMELFLDSDREFKNQIKKIRDLLAKNSPLGKQIAAIHTQYTTLFQEWFKNQDNLGSSQKEYDTLISEKQNQLINLIQEVSDMTTRDQNKKNQALSLIGSKAFRVIAIICIISIIIGIGAALVITHNISTPLGLLKKATHEISKGNFDHIPEIKNNDEIGDLAHSFNEMAKRLKNIEEMYLDANPLTRLPGGVAIENVLKKRMSAGTPIAFCLIDLDHFKIFNDHYGYSQGNKVIIATAKLIEDAIEKYGNKNDFVGHIGGDDFVMVTALKRFKKICEFIIKSFDQMILQYYDQKDLEKGYIEAKSRSGKHNKFSIMSISIAVVTTKGNRFKHHVRVIEVATELKNYAKSIPKSLFIVDRRKRNSL